MLGVCVGGFCVVWSVRSEISLLDVGKSSAGLLEMTLDEGSCEMIGRLLAVELALRKTAETGS